MNKSKILLVIIVSLLILLSSLIFKALIKLISVYLLSFAGIYIFYTTYLKKHKVGLILGAAIFMIGTILFVTSKYEIPNIGNVFIPLFLFIIGSSILLGNILIKADLISIIFSSLSLFAGTWLIISRGDTNLALFISALFSIAKNYWLVVLGSVILILTIIGFKKKS